jgi:hypothetical protein
MGGATVVSVKTGYWCTNMWPTYEDYCSDMRKRRLTPLSREAWQKAYPPQPTEYKDPLLASPKTRRIEPINRWDFVKAEDYFDAIDAQELLVRIRNAK